jgi:ABC-type multidrug transport system fused ATPase/permease subunit
MEKGNMINQHKTRDMTIVLVIFIVVLIIVIFIFKKYRDKYEKVKASFKDKLKKLRHTQERLRGVMGKNNDISTTIKVHEEVLDELDD